MNIQLINPRKSLNKAFLKQKSLRSEIELLMANLDYQVDELVYWHSGITEKERRVIEGEK
jgi:hypothetical protein